LSHRAPSEILGGMGLGKGKTQHAGPRDMSRKDGHYGFTEEAKAFATAARRRDEKELVRRETETSLQEKEEVLPEED
jgi:hypothetical protein